MIQLTFQYGIRFPVRLAILLLAWPAIVFGQQDAWLDPRLSKLPTDKLGPFVLGSKGQVIALDSDATFVSNDSGKTWSDPRPLKGALAKGIRVSNERAFFRTKSGTLIAAFMNLNERRWTWDNAIHDAPGAKLPTWVMRSTDDGATWQHVQKLHDDWTGAVRDMIQTKDGRIILTAMKMRHDPGRHAVLTYSSDDDGVTWWASNLIDLGGRGHHGGVTEPTLVELADGRIWMLIRTNWGEFWSAYSFDGGRFWRIIKPSGIPASSAPGMLSRLSSGRLVLVWNRPFPEGKTEWPLSGGDGLWSETPVSNHREELSIAWSNNDGETWTKPVVIAHKRETPGGGSRRWAAYPYLFERRPGELWLTTMQGSIRARFRERDFVGKTVVAFGDSTTAPRGALKIYSDLLNKEFPKGIVNNAGVGGDSTSRARTRFDRDVRSKNPDAVIIQFGINDAAIDVWKTPPANAPRVSLKDYEANLRHFIRTLKADGAEVILMTPNPLRWTPKLEKLYGKPPYRPDDPDGFNVELKKYADVVRKLACSEKVPLVDVYQAFEDYGKKDGQSIDALLLDGMHPGAEGHRLAADLLIKAIRRSLENTTNE